MSVMHIWGLSDKGLKRSENQDCFMINDLVSREEIKLEIDDEADEADEADVKTKRVLCAVADGIGGQKGGALASETVLEHIGKSIKDVPTFDDIENAHLYLHKLVLECHNNLLEMSEKDESIINMGTTFVGVYMEKSFGLVLHAGDSRLYCIRNGKMIRLTRDHSLENYLKDTTKDYEPTIKSGIITNCLGGGKGSECEPEINKLTFLEGDILLLCSDGLTDMLEDKTLERLLSGGEKLEVKGKKLIDAANDSGGMDNITVILIEKI